MVRKRVSNLNPEESKKVPQPKVESTPAQPEESASLPISAEADEKPKNEKPKTEAFSIEPLEIDVPYVEVKDENPTDRQPLAASSDPPSDSLSDPPSDAAPASGAPDPVAAKALEATIAQLTTTLETVRHTARHRETDLLDQISQLQAALEAKQTLADQLQSELESRQTQIKQLQAELKQSSQLQTELEDAKKMILQLSQVNAQPAPSAPLPSQMRAAEPELESTPQRFRSAPAKSQSAKSQGDDRQPAPITLQRQPSYPARQSPFIIPSEKRPSEPLIEQNGKLSDADLGWVD